MVMAVMGVTVNFVPGWQAGQRNLASQRLLPLLGIALLLVLGAGCGGSARLSAAPAAGSLGLAELQLKLAAEFARLGIDPGKVAAQAPQGAENAVFDLAATVIDPDGPPDGAGGGELPPTAIKLKWTERLIGDYDQNGEVNISDLSPLALYWGPDLHTVAYDAPALHGGFEGWPNGEPEDAGALNWRKARIDGDGNGEINISDISPIAQHWKQNIGGYSIYRRDPEAEDFTLLASVERPEVVVGYPVRYSFAEQPPVGGSYSYYVVAYGGDPDDAAEAHSNTAVLQLEYGFADTLPPVWDTTTGVVEAVANSDGTITVSWGGATDVAPVGVLPHPPVSFTIYWSTISPVDYENAAFAEQVTSPWTSPQLLDGQTYYFAVRAHDSMTPPNQEQNAVEAEVTDTGGVTVDDTPPAWITVGWPDSDQYTSYVYGIADVHIHNGYLTVKRGRAMDILSPPVKNVLYYVSARESFKLIDSGELVPEAEVLEDIPLEFDFPWENRHPVIMLAAALDSAPVPNRTFLNPGYQFKVAPSDLRRVQVNTAFPYDSAPLVNDYYDGKGFGFDPFTHTLYQLYATDTGEGGDRYELRCVVWDCETGTWHHELIGLGPEGADAAARSMAISPDGESWVQFSHNYGPFEWSQTTWHRTSSGTWERFETEIPLPWHGQFDHTGHPTWVSFIDSDVQPGKRYKSLYHYFDPVAHKYKSETVADPGGKFETHIKPDGTVFAVMGRDEYPSTEAPPEARVRVFRRNAIGQWDEEFSNPGMVIFHGGYYADYWSENWQWTHEVNVSGGDITTYYVLAGTSEGVIFWGPVPPPPDLSEYVGGDYQPASPDAVHQLTFNWIWDGDSYTKMGYNNSTRSYLLHDLLFFHPVDECFYNRADGFLFTLQVQPADDSSEYQLFANIMEPGDSLYELNP